MALKMPKPCYRDVKVANIQVPNSGSERAEVPDPELIEMFIAPVPSVGWHLEQTLLLGPAVTRYQGRPAEMTDASPLTWSHQGIRGSSKDD